MFAYISDPANKDTEFVKFIHETAEPYHSNIHVNYQNDARYVKGKQLEDAANAATNSGANFTLLPAKSASEINDLLYLYDKISEYSSSGPSYTGGSITLS